MGKTNTVRALSRGLAVLRAIEDRPGASLHELSAACGLSKPVLLRMIATLEAEGYVRRGLTDRLYYANLRVPAPPDETRRSLLAEAAAPVLDRLCQEVLWPSDIAVYSDGFMRVQETSRRRSPFMMNRAVTRYGIHVLQSGMGRAFLAHCDSGTRESIMARLARSPDRRDRLARDKSAIDALIADVRTKGYATRETGYFITQPMEARVSAIAIPVIADMAAIGSVNLVWIAQAASEAQFVRRYLPRLAEASKEIARRFADIADKQ